MSFMVGGFQMLSLITSRTLALFFFLTSLLLVSLSCQALLAQSVPSAQKPASGHDKPAASTGVKEQNSVSSSVRSTTTKAIEAMRTQRLAEAEKLFAAAVAEQERYKPDDPELAPLLGNLATCYEQMGRLDKAALLYRRALSIKAKAKGVNEEEYATMHDSLGKIYMQEGKYKEARTEMIAALHILEKASPSGDLNVALNLSNIAQLDVAQRNYAEAEAFYKRAGAIIESVLGPDHLNTVTLSCALAELYKKEGRYNEAETLYKSALATARRVLGPNHPVTTTATQQYADLLQRMNRKSEALQLFRELMPRQPVAK
jgi:tetratricopeptide (TPR) repeat protein